MGLLSKAKSDDTILLEAGVVGLLLVILYLCLHLVLGRSYITLFVAGALFHILCEISGLNKWYVDNYYNDMI